MLDCQLCILVSHIDPKLYVIIPLVCNKWFCNDGIEYYLPFRCKEICENSCPLLPLLLEYVDVLSHKALEKRLAVSPLYRYDAPVM
jgi:hypothetical protein